MNYIREQSVGEILKTSLSIYFKHFGAIILVLLLLFPIYCLTGIPETIFIGFFLSFFIYSLVIASLTVIISEVCLGYKPSPARAYKRVFGTIFGKVVATGLLFTLVFFIGFLLFIIPGIIFFLWFVLCQVVVVLEGKWGRDALKRSKELGKGFYLRILVVLIIMYGLILVPSFVIGFISAFVGEAGFILIALLQTLIVPIALIPLVLMYYDLRVRKESYDSTALAEDLKQ